MSGLRVVIEVEGGDVKRVAAQLPRAETLGPGTHLVALAGKSRGWLGKLLPPRDAPSQAVLGSALLARGYVNIGAGQDGGRDAAWGDSGLSVAGDQTPPAPAPA